MENPKIEKISSEEEKLILNFDAKARDLIKALQKNPTIDKSVINEVIQKSKSSNGGPISIKDVLDCSDEIQLEKIKKENPKVAEQIKNFNLSAQDITKIVTKRKTTQITPVDVEMYLAEKIKNENAQSNANETERLNEEGKRAMQELQIKRELEEKSHLEKYGTPIDYSQEENKTYHTEFYNAENTEYSSHNSQKEVFKRDLFNLAVLYGIKPQDANYFLTELQKDLGREISLLDIQQKFEGNKNLSTENSNNYFIEKPIDDKIKPIMKELPPASNPKNKKAPGPRPFTNPVNEKKVLSDWQKFKEYEEDPKNTAKENEKSLEIENKIKQLRAEQEKIRRSFDVKKPTPKTKKTAVAKEPVSIVQATEEQIRSILNPTILANENLRRSVEKEKQANDELKEQLAQLRKDFEELKKGSDFLAASRSTTSATSTPAPVFSPVLPKNVSDSIFEKQRKEREEYQRKLDEEWSKISILQKEKKEAEENKLETEKKLAEIERNKKILIESQLKATSQKEADEALAVFLASLSSGSTTTPVSTTATTSPSPTPTSAVPGTPTASVSSSPTAPTASTSPAPSSTGPFTRVSSYTPPTPKTPSSSLFGGVVLPPLKGAPVIPPVPPTPVSPTSIASSVSSAPTPTTASTAIPGAPTKKPELISNDDKNLTKDRVDFIKAYVEHSKKESGRRGIFGGFALIMGHQSSVRQSEEKVFQDKEHPLTKAKDKYFASRAKYFNKKMDELKTYHTTTSLSEEDKQREISEMRARNIEDMNEDTRNLDAGWAEVNKGTISTSIRNKYETYAKLPAWKKWLYSGAFLGGVTVASAGVGAVASVGLWGGWLTKKLVIAPVASRLAMSGYNAAVFKTEHRIEDDMERKQKQNREAFETREGLIDAMSHSDYFMKQRAEKFKYDTKRSLIDNGRMVSGLASVAAVGYASHEIGEAYANAHPHTTPHTETHTTPADKTPTTSTEKMGIDDHHDTPKHAPTVAVKPPGIDESTQEPDPDPSLNNPPKPDTPNPTLYNGNGQPFVGQPSQPLPTLNTPVYGGDNGYHQGGYDQSGQPYDQGQGVPVDGRAPFSISGGVGVGQDGRVIGGGQVSFPVGQNGGQVTIGGGVDQNHNIYGGGGYSNNGQGNGGWNSSSSGNNYNNGGGLYSSQVYGGN